MRAAKERNRKQLQLAAYDLHRYPMLISEDPIGLAGGINMYAYTGNDPINSSDPMGLQSEDCRIQFGPHCPPIVVSGIANALWDFSQVFTSRFGHRDFGGEFGSTPMSGGGTTGRTPQTGRTNGPRQTPQVEPPSAAKCAAAYYGVGDIALRGFLTAPIPKRWVGLPVLPGASSFTNATSLIGFKLFPGLKLGTQILGTNRVFGLAGRASAIGGGVMLVYDASTIALCSSRYGL